MWTRFMDMHSGGGQKLSWAYIYIEAPEEEAKIIFYNKFDHNPENITCHCCGGDYSISSKEDLTQLTAYDRGCDFGYFDGVGREITKDEYDNNAYKSEGERLKYSWRYVERFRSDGWSKKYVSIDEFVECADRLGKMNGNTNLLIYDSDILKDERIGGLPEEEYYYEET